MKINKLHGKVIMTEDFNAPALIALPTIKRTQRITIELDEIFPEILTLKYKKIIIQIN